MGDEDNGDAVGLEITDVGFCTAIVVLLYQRGH
jgi:hypothetical protein